MAGHPLPFLQNQRGATLITVLVMLVVMGVTLGITGASWKTITQRAREAELLWRGQQYVHAIENYYATRQPNQPKVDLEDRTQAKGYTGALPREVDHLLKDNRFAQSVRHLRQQYQDPMTGEDFVFLKDPGGRIKGVRSAGEEKPFKQEGFTDELDDFNGAEKYSDWLFVFDVPAGTAPRSGVDTGTGGGIPTLPQEPDSKEPSPEPPKPERPEPIPGERGNPPPGYGPDDGFYRGGQWYWHLPSWKRPPQQQ